MSHRRIHKYASCSNECFVLALIYIDRLIQRNNFLLTDLNVHRVVITAILLAAKFFDDAYYNNAYYSKVGGVLVSEMNGLEVDFLFRINFSLHVPPELFEKYKAELMAHSQSMMEPTVASTPSAADEVMMQQQQPSSDLAPNSSHCMAVSVIPEGQAIADPMALTNVGPLHHHSVQVTPSPHNSAAAPYALDQQRQIKSCSQQQGMFVDSHNMFGSGMDQQQQQFLQLQRSASLPAQVTQYAIATPSRCSQQQANPPYSAPMVSMVPQGLVSDNEQYLLQLNQTLFPLQTTLVHHNHGVVQHHHQSNNAYHHHHHQGGTAQQAGSYGDPLVAGHY
jgi:hypothetical protein